MMEEDKTNQDAIFFAVWIDTFLRLFSREVKVAGKIIFGPRFARFLSFFFYQDFR